MIWRIALWLGLIAATAFAQPYIDEQTATASTTQATCNGTSATVISGGARHAVTITNNSSVSTYVCYAATCTTAIGTLLVQSACLTEQNYTGIITCITAGSTATLGVLKR